MRRRRRSNPLQSLIYIIILIAIVLITKIYNYKKPHETYSIQKHVLYNDSLRLGNPSNAQNRPSNKNNYLINNKYFTLSYNNSKGTPNWVCWRLTKSDIGDAERTEFYPDTSLPSGFQMIRPSDYTGSGFDRGHMCPHSDRSADDDMSRSTFVMTNIIPQSPELNEKTWNYMESYCRDLANQGKILYIIDGPYGKGGVGRDGYREQIGENNTVVVPSKCWKVIMVLNGGPGDDIKKITSHTRLIAVIIPNNMNVDEDWSKYRVSVAQVEKLTGYKFFDKAPAAVIGPLKLKVDKITIPPLSNKYGY